MEPHELLLWIIIGLLVGALLLLVANQLIFNMMNVNVAVKTP